MERVIIAMERGVRKGYTVEFETNAEYEAARDLADALRLLPDRCTPPHHTVACYAHGVRGPECDLGVENGEHSA